MKTFVLLGAGPGVGFETAKRFAKEGYKIILFARTKEKLEEVKRDLEKEGATVELVQGDLSDVEGLRETIGSLEQIDVLHYNASILEEKDLLTVSVEQIERELRIDTTAMIAAVQAAYSALKKSADPTVLVTGGGLGLNPSAGLPGLSLGKASVRALAQMWHDRLKDDGIYVGMVTINGMVERGTAFDPAIVAEQFHQLHEKREKLETIIEED